MSDFEHHLWLQPGLDPQLALILCGIWLDGFVEKEVVSSRDWLVNPLSEHQVQMRLRHPGSSVWPERAALGIYNLLLGFFRLGLDVRLEGPWSANFPTLHHADRPELKLRPLYQDQLPLSERTPEVEIEVLLELAHTLPGARRAALKERYEVLNQRTRSEISFRHASGLRFVALFGSKFLSSYCLPELAPYCQRGRLIAWGPARPARTWGEAWIGSYCGAHCRLPQGLAILPEEVAIVLGEDVARYAIEDREGLNQLEVLNFGPGLSPLYDGHAWLRLAQSCGESEKYQLAVACCEQALLSLPEAAADLKRWQDWVKFRQQPPPPEPPRNIPVRPLAELIRRTGAEELAEVAQEIREEVADAHDYRRRTFALRERIGPGLRLVYAQVTGAELLQAQVSPSALARLGYSCNPIPPGEVFADLFTVRFGEHVIWGNVDSGGFLLQSDPGRVYRG
ncbi:hypothetical protein JST97_32980 [bacterium]|nr:hypothetical protein [bacterium]